MKTGNYESILSAITEASKPLLVAIDGRACSGKSTLTRRLAEVIKATTFNIDDLFVPFREQDPDMKPDFPFPYFRYNEFLEGVRTLKRGEPFSFRPYDWGRDTTSLQKICVTPSQVTFVEGVSSLNIKTSDLFDIRIFVVSDPSTQMAAAMDRDGQKFEKFWLEHWLPSEEIYFRTRPWLRADYLYPGRGVALDEVSSYL